MRWLAILLLAGPEYADDIVCTYAGDEVTIRLHDRTAFGRDFDCIHGSFLGNALPCAPNGAFSLYGPNGQFQGITTGRDYLSHQGSVIGHFIDVSTIAFTGGYGGANGYQQMWRFVVDRASGNAQLARGEQTVSYRCSNS